MSLLIPHYEPKVVIRQCRYLNNIVEQDHRAVKRITRPIQGFKDFRCAGIILGGVELMHMIRKRADARRRERSVCSSTILHAGGETDRIADQARDSAASF